MMIMDHESWIMGRGGGNWKGQQEAERTREEEEEWRHRGKV
jgi:hypothetical protein